MGTLAEQLGKKLGIEMPTTKESETKIFVQNAKSTQGAIDDRVEGIMLRFVVGNVDIASSISWDSPVNDPNRVPGVRFIYQGHKVGVRSFADDLKAAGWIMTRCTGKVIAGEFKTAYGLNFLFKRQPLEYLPELAQGTPEMFERLISDSMWTVDAYRNHGSAEGRFGISISHSARELLVEKDGSPRFTWNRDRFKQKVGDAKPVVPAQHLRLIEGKIVLE